jgi:ectoine hydroxylase-related dioxygenase (phytanoyl-CoA dioxygenase family)
MAKGVSGFDAVTDREIRQFLSHGYLVVENAFSPDEISAALAGLLDLIDGRHPDFKGVQFEASAREVLPTLLAGEKQDVVRKLMSFVEYDERLKAISAHPVLLDVLTRIIGEQPALFQDMAMLKPPYVGREKPWHQDIAFFALPPETIVVGVWIALDEALPENGCMHIIPGSHRDGPVTHFQRRDFQICDTEIVTDQVVAVPLKPGSLLFFHGLIHHGSPPSRSPLRRRALQLHYKPASVPWTSEEERLAVFGSDGKDATC